MLNMEAMRRLTDLHIPAAGTYVSRYVKTPSNIMQCIANSINPGG